VTIDAAIRELVRDVVRDVVREEMVALSTRCNDGETDAPSDYVSAKTAAAIADVNEETIRVWVRRGALPAYWAGRLLRIKRADLDRFMATGGDGEDVDVEEAARRILGKA